MSTTFNGNVMTCENDNPPFFSRHKTVVENKEIMLCITAVLTVHVEVSVMEIARGIFQLMKEHQSLILQPYIEPRLYFRNIFPYFPHGQLPFPHTHELLAPEKIKKTFLIIGEGYNSGPVLFV